MLYNVCMLGFTRAMLC